MDIQGFKWTNWHIYALPGHAWAYKDVRGHIRTYKAIYGPPWTSLSYYDIIYCGVFVGVLLCQFLEHRKNLLLVFVRDSQCQVGSDR
jgi:hypothetical protein